MSGFVERVIEDWLTKADERSYQLPFAASLSRDGHAIKYISPHGPFEHGKDIITVHTRKIHAYQLKAGSINESQWRAISAEVLEAATVPIDVPGMPHRLADNAFLVLTGHVSDTVRHQIGLVNEEHKRRRYAEIQLIELMELVGKFTQVFEGFCPARIEPITRLTQLYLRDSRGSQDKSLLFETLGSIVSDVRGAKKVARALTDVVVAAQFAGAGFARARNHLSTIDTWVIAATQILRTARRAEIDPRVSRQMLDLCREAILAASDQLIDECHDREDFFADVDHVTDMPFAGFRKTLTVGYVAAALNSQCISQGRDSVREESYRLLETLRRPPPLSFWGEGAWNYLLNTVVALGCTPIGANVAAVLLEQWLRYVCPRSGPDVRDPYWTAADELSLTRRRERAAPAGVERARISYSAPSAISLLARRLFREPVASTWANVSRFQHALFIPADADGMLAWHCEEGITQLEIPPYRQSWQALRRRSWQERSDLFGDSEAWLLPYFLCTYPHRISTGLSGALDFHTAAPTLRSEWTTVVA